MNTVLYYSKLKTQVPVVQIYSTGTVFTVDLQYSTDTVPVPLLYSTAQMYSTGTVPVCIYYTGRVQYNKLQMIIYPYNIIIQHCKYVFNIHNRYITVPVARH